MATFRNHSRGLSRRVNSQNPLRLFNFLKVKVLQLRHQREKPAPDELRKSPGFGQEVDGNRSVIVDENVHRTCDTEYDFASSGDKEVNNEQQGYNLVSNPTADNHYASKNVHELIKLGGIRPASLQGCLGTASSKTAPFLEVELVFGVEFLRDQICCYRARTPILTCNTFRGADDEFRREPTRRAGESLASGKEPLPEPSKRLACPYLINDPRTYESRQGCRGAAFTDSSRLKEHLYRCHKQKPHCTKCGEPFANDTAQANHRSCSSDFLHPFTGRFLQEFQGFDEEQEAKLKDKKRKRGESNEEKWKDIFRILFPSTVEIPSPYYKSPAYERSQDRTAKTDNMKYGFTNNLFENQVPEIEMERIARSKMEKLTGSLSEEVWTEMKEIFRDLAFSGAKAFRIPTAPNMNRQHPKSSRDMESPIIACGSSASSTSHQLRHPKRTAGRIDKGNLDRKDIQFPVLKGDYRLEDQDNGIEPDVVDILPGVDIDTWLSGVGGMFGQRPRSIPLSRPNQASLQRNLHSAHESAQPTRPSPPSEPNSSSTSGAPCRSETRADEAKSRTELSVPSKGAISSAISLSQEATAEVCEEIVFNNLNLSPEECLVAAFKHKMPIWKGPENSLSPE